MSAQGGGEGAEEGSIGGLVGLARSPADDPAQRGGHGIDVERSPRRVVAGHRSTTSGRQR
jgi:hypothetical protein